METRSVEADQEITTTIAHIPPEIVHGLHRSNAGFEKNPKSAQKTRSEAVVRIRERWHCHTEWAF
jgi:hypothetical protein